MMSRETNSVGGIELARSAHDFGEVVVAIDFGGTNIRAGIVNRKGRILSRIDEKTNAYGSRDEIYENLAGVVRKLISEFKARVPKSACKIVGIGVGTPGRVDLKTGAIVGINENLPEWTGVPLKAWLERDFKLPAFVANDADAAALGEMYYGGAKKMRNFVLLTLGTGVGGGIVINGKLVSGRYSAGEIGHLPIAMGGRQCNCGNRGCLEAYASATALVKMAHEAISSGRKTEIVELAGGEDKITSEIICRAAKSGDPVALEIFRIAGDAIAEAVVGIINLLNPEAIFFSGGVSNAGDLLFAPVRKKMTSVLSPPFSETPIKMSSLGGDAGILGAASLVWNEME